MTGSSPGSPGELRGVVLRVSVIPGARRERVSRLANGRIRAFVAAPSRSLGAGPDERGSANECLIRLFARTLEVPEDAIGILSGAGHPQKLIRVGGVTRQKVAARIKSLHPGHYQGRRNIRRPPARKKRRAIVNRTGVRG